jgi:hypothetical protein
MIDDALAGLMCSFNEWSVVGSDEITKHARRYDACGGVSTSMFEDVEVGTGERFDKPKFPSLENLQQLVDPLWIVVRFYNETRCSYETASVLPTSALTKNIKTAYVAPYQPALPEFLGSTVHSINVAVRGGNVKSDNLDIAFSLIRGS